LAVLPGIGQNRENVHFLHQGTNQPGANFASGSMTGMLDVWQKAQPIRCKDFQILAFATSSATAPELPGLN